jgi:hypothetical protein
MPELLEAPPAESDGQENVSLAAGDAHVTDAPSYDPRHNGGDLVGDDDLMPVAADLATELFPQAPKPWLTRLTLMIREKLQTYGLTRVV